MTSIGIISPSTFGTFFLCDLCTFCCSAPPSQLHNMAWLTIAAWWLVSGCSFGRSYLLIVIPLRQSNENALSAFSVDLDGPKDCWDFFFCRAFYSGIIIIINNPTLINIVPFFINQSAVNRMNLYSALPRGEDNLSYYRWICVQWSPWHPGSWTPTHRGRNLFKELL